MKKLIITAALLSSVAIVAGCSLPSKDMIDGSGESHAYYHANNIPSHGVALEGYCPVAYFAVGKPLRGTPEYAASHEGVTYHFVSAEAKQEFLRKPEQYVPAYGGWCAFGMAVEDKFPVDPTQFKIVDGRLMLFLRNEDVDALELWNGKNEDELVRRADQHWRRVQG